MVIHPERRALLLVLLAFFVMSTKARAQSGPELLFKPWATGQRLEGQADATFLKNGHTNNGDDFQLSYYNTQGRLRIWPEQKADPRIGYNITYLNTDTNDPALPSHMVDTSVAIGTGIADISGWRAGLTVGIGYAAVGAFDDGNAWYGKADLLLGHDIDETSSIGFVIDYDGNRTVWPDIPLPGVLYTKRLDPTILLGLGFPFSSVEWKPRQVPNLTITAKYVIPDDADARIDYTVFKNFGVFASYAARRDAFHWDEISNPDDRLLFQQRRAELGVRWTAHETVSLILAGGYAFSQEFNVGWDFREADRIAKPSDEPYVRFGLEVRF
jgi:hypothetical protein